MTKLRERAPNIQRPRQRHTPAHQVKVASARQHVALTAECYPKMSREALAFARRMRANPHVQAVMRTSPTNS